VDTHPSAYNIFLSSLLSMITLVYIARMIIAWTLYMYTPALLVISTFTRTRSGPIRVTNPGESDRDIGFGARVIDLHLFDDPREPSCRLSISFNGELRHIQRVLWFEIGGSLRIRCWDYKMRIRIPRIQTLGTVKERLKRR